MSILIQGMEMPQICAKCGLYIEGACYAKGYRDYRSIMDTAKPDDCPLIELPPHGRLIDADRIDFRNDAMHDGKGNLVVADDFVSGVKWVNDCIERTLSAIPAPHGNLKDESDIISLIEVMFCRDKDGMEHAIQCVKDAPVVIEAEGET